MDFLTFIVEIVGRTIWPIFFVILIYLFKDSFADLILNISSIKHSKTEINFGKDIKSVKKVASANPKLSIQSSVENDVTISELAQLSPRGAVIEAWLNIESAIKEFRNRHGLEERNKKQFRIRELEQYKNEYDSLGDDIIAILYMLKKLRNEAVHMQDSSIGKKAAGEYQHLADKVINAIDQA